MVKRAPLAIALAALAAAIAAPAGAQDQPTPPAEPQATTQGSDATAQEGAAPAQDGDAPANADPTAAFTGDPAPPVAGSPVTFDGSQSSDPDGAIARYEWDLDGDGTFEVDSGGVATTTTTFAQPGPVRVTLRVSDRAGATDEETVELAVADPPAPPDPEAIATPPAGPSTGKATPKRERDDDDESSSSTASRAQVSSAASRGVTIRDFSYSPRTVSVGVGDTVTWTNQGPTVHTATARDGSFDTGNLSRGQSGSATFRRAGTIAYYCKPHPFMRATVVVGGGGSGGGTSGAGTDDSGEGGGDAGGTGGAGSSGDASGGGLAQTGFAVGGLALAGQLLLGAGLGLRRRVGGAEPQV